MSKEKKSAIIKIIDLDDEHIKVEVIFSPPLSKPKAGDLIPLAHLMAMRAMYAIEHDGDVKPADGVIH